MLDLLKHYSIDRIVIFVVLLAVALKGAFTWFEWAVEKLRNKFGKENEANKRKEEIKKDLDEIKKTQEEMTEAIKELTKNVDLLMTSDKDDIKAWITEKHHYFCYELGYIDDYNLDCIEKRYSHYKTEGGNSFVDDLMAEIRSLPKIKATATITKENK